MSLCCFGNIDGEEVVPSPRPMPSRLSDPCFFVITTVFNPSGFQSRYDLYDQFASHMRRTGAQLITVECIFPNLGQHTFSVTNPLDPHHIQLKSDSVYWMKESLINIASARLPAHAAWVCWLDADIEFTNPNWVAETKAALKEYSIVQVFDKAEFLGPSSHIKVLRTDYSFGYSVVKGKVIDQARYDEWYPHPGYGWATTVNIFRHIGGLPEYDVVGSGDLHFAFSMIGRVSNALEQNLNPDFKKHILDHSTRLHETVSRISTTACKKPVGYIPVTIRHYWHGSRKNRQYVDRWKILIAHNFNYERDTRRNADGLLEFIGPNGTALQRDILQHFVLRNEDSSKQEAEDERIVANKRSHDPKKLQVRHQQRPPPYNPGSKGTNLHSGHTSNYDYMAAFAVQNAMAANQDQDYGGHGQDCYPPDYASHGHHHSYDQQQCFSGGGDYASNYGGTVSCTSQY